MVIEITPDRLLFTALLVIMSGLWCMYEFGRRQQRRDAEQRRRFLRRLRREREQGVDVN